MLGEVPRAIDNQAMILSVQHTSKHRQQALDLAFWLSRPMAERMAAVEALRLPMYAPTGQTPDGGTNRSDTNPNCRRASPGAFSARHRATPPTNPRTP